MIGFDFPIKPQWIHDVHALWQPAQSINELVEAALAHTMQELGGEKTRRNSLTVILRYFVEAEGGGQSRRTVEQDVWVAYSRAYPASTMAPAYLAHLIAQNEVAQEASHFVNHRYTPGDILTSAELRRQIVGQFGERKVAINAVSAFLRTLQYFGVLTEGERLGEYRFTTRLQVSREVFPLVVWAWWQRYLSPQIDLEEFAKDAEAACLQSEGLHAHWLAYRFALWTLEERLEAHRATLKPAAPPLLMETLLSLVDDPAGKKRIPE